MKVGKDVIDRFPIVLYYVQFGVFMSSNCPYFHFKEKMICSDRHETLMAVSVKDALNPGDRMAVTSDLGNSNNIGKIQGSVEAVTVQDIMEKCI